MLDAATLAIQELLKSYAHLESLQALQPPPSEDTPASGAGGASGRAREPTPAAAEGNLLFSALAAEVQVRLGRAGQLLKV